MHMEYCRESWDAEMIDNKIFCKSQSIFKNDRANGKITFFMDIININGSFIKNAFLTNHGDDRLHKKEYKATVDCCKRQTTLLVKKNNKQSNSSSGNISSR